MKPKSNYKLAADLTREAKTIAQLERREEGNRRLYENGCLTVSEYSRLSEVEMRQHWHITNMIKWRRQAPQDKHGKPHNKKPIKH